MRAASSRSRRIETAAAGEHVFIRPDTSSLGPEIAALTANDCLRAGFGAGFVDYFVRLKQGELARYQNEETHSPEATAWEQRGAKAQPGGCARGSGGS